MGHIWSVLSPCMMLGLYLFVFGLIFGGRFGILKDENIFDFALALFLGLSLFNAVAETISSSPTIILAQPNLVKKVVFPLEIIPLSKVIASLYNSLLSIFICILLIPLSHAGFNIQIILLPILLFPLAMICLGLSWGLSAIGVFYRDINNLTAFASTALMYASAIVYSPSRIPTKLSFIFKFNPILNIIDQSRRITLWHQSISLSTILIVYLTSTLILLLGYYLFVSLKPFFAEVL